MSAPSTSLETINFELSPIDNERLANLCGHLDEHLRMLERGFGIEVNNRGSKFQIIGPVGFLAVAQAVINELYAETSQSVLAPEQVHLAIREVGGTETVTQKSSEEIIIKTKRGLVKARGDNQQAYLRRVMTHDINFGIGPAGTGKTYLAVACAVEALERDFARRIVLVRPAVEAGENLGFLPGDMKEKLDPYMQPLYDALKEMIDSDKLNEYMKRGVIEIAPLAYMRGRTLDDAFVILDEGQNTTHNQMKMFLTRMGVNAKFMINGDPGQIDLPRRVMSGLKEANLVLKNIEGIKMIYLDDSDVIRHPVVKRIIKAYKNTEHTN